MHPKILVIIKMLGHRYTPDGWVEAARSVIVDANDPGAVLMACYGSALSLHYGKFVAETIISTEAVRT